MRLIPWKRTGKRVIEAIDAGSGVEVPDKEGKASRATTLDTLVPPSGAATLCSNTERSGISTAAGGKGRWGLIELEPQDDNDSDAVDIVALHGLVSLVIPFHSLMVPFGMIKVALAH